MGEVQSDQKRRNSFWVINGVEYPVKKVIDSGSFGEVSYCREVASKKIIYRSDDYEKAKASFLKEIDLTSTRYEFALGRHYPKYNTFIFAMPFIGGGRYRYRNRIDNSMCFNDGYRSRSEFLRTYFKIMVEVYFLHTKFGIMHGDLKFSNLRIYLDQVFLLDFGLAHKMGDMTIPWGFASYRAPEFKDSVKASPSGDIFSLGYMLRMFDEDVNSYLKKQNPKSADLLSIPELKKLYKKMTEKNPKKRITLLAAMSEFIEFFNKSDFGKTAPIAFDAKTIEQDFKPSSLPKVLATPALDHKIESDVPSMDEKVTVKLDENVKSKKPPRTPYPSPASVEKPQTDFMFFQPTEEDLLNKRRGAVSPTPHPSPFTPKNP
jgi:serine/threonine protein kinase